MPNPEPHRAEPQHPDAGDLFAAAPLPVAVLDDAQRVACLRLIRSESVGPATFRALINHYGGAAAALEALPEIGRRAGRARPVRIHSKAAAEAEIDAAEAAGVALIFTIEPGYPAPLAFTEGAPPLLYVKGRKELLNSEIIAIVGSRQASAAGLQLTRSFAATFGQNGLTVASGLARGIDGVAHQAALDTGTIAVVAGGLDVIYPPEHRELQAEIAEKGCLVSEMPLGFQPRAQDFPRRNRIISGLSRAIVVIEAARRSGTLITARLANEQGRDVFAVPGHPLDPRAEGTNQLLKDGAGLATSAEDVIAALATLPKGPGFRAGAGRAPTWEDSGVDSRGDAGRDSGGHAAGASEGGAAAPRHSMAAYAELSRTPPAAGIGLRDAGEDPDADAGAGQTASVSGEGHAMQEVARVLGPSPVSFDDIGRATGLGARAVQVAIMELSLADRIEFHGAQLVSLKPLPR